MSRVRCINSRSGSKSTCAVEEQTASTLSLTRSKGEFCRGMATYRSNVHHWLHACTLQNAYACALHLPYVSLAPH